MKIFVNKNYQIVKAMRETQKKQNSNYIFHVYFGTVLG